LAPQAHADITYIAIGDSLAFGVGDNDTATDISNGDRGYVSLFADKIGSTLGGVRPKVINLGVSGETTTSFITGEGGIHPGASLRNTNYPNAVTPQFSLLQSTLAAEQAAGNQVGYITLHLGANDVNKVILDPTFPGLSPPEQQARILAALAAMQANLVETIGALTALAPGAYIQVLGYFNPFPAIPNHPATPLSALVVTSLNQIIEQVSGVLGTQYVGIYDDFLGREAELTYFDETGTNVHPTPAGYQLIANRLRAVPEPSTLVSGSIACILVCAAGLRIKAKNSRSVRHRSRSL
jgi:lysophospholipase L1-like esterase